MDLKINILFLSRFFSKVYHCFSCLNLQIELQDHAELVTIINSLQFKFKDTCKSQLSNQIMNNVCSEDYSLLNEEKNDFEPKWATYTSAPTTNVDKAFMYSKSSTLDSYPYFGLYTTYMGGGYVMILDYSKTVAALVSELDDLQQKTWIDQRTRALFIEFSLYNPSLNLFTYSTILFEYLPTGNMIKSVVFNPFTVYTYESSFGLLSTACSFLYVAIIIFFTIKEIKKIYKLRKQYFKQFWPYIEWSLLIFSYVSCAMYAYRMYAKSELMEKLEKRSATPSTIIKLQTLSYWNDIFMVFISICSFIATLKFMKILRFSRNINFLITTFKNGFKDIVCFLIIFCVIWLAYVSLMFLIFHDKVKGFTTFTYAMETTFLIFVGKFEAQALFASSSILGPIIFFSFNIVLVLVLVNMLISIITDAFAISRLDYKEQNKDEDSLIIEFIKTKFNALFNNKGKQKTNDYNENYNDYVDTLEAKITRLADQVDSINYAQNKDLNIQLTDRMKAYEKN